MAGDHKCPVCQATFTRPQHVARHMRSHTGDRPYKCQHCGDQFARSDLLSRHINKCHAAEKPPTTNAPNQRRKGATAACRATTSKQACDQCVTGTLPCDGANPCTKCVQRKTRCTYVKFHRQTAPSGPGHQPPPRAQSDELLDPMAYTVLPNGRYAPQTELIYPGTDAAALALANANAMYAGPGAGGYSYAQNAGYNAGAPLPPPHSQEQTMDPLELAARYRQQAELLRRQGLLPPAQIVQPEDQTHHGQYMPGTGNGTFAYDYAQPRYAQSQPPAWMPENKHIQALDQLSYAGQYSRPPGPNYHLHQNQNYGLPPPQEHTGHGHNRTASYPDTAAYRRNSLSGSETSGTGTTSSDAPTSSSSAQSSIYNLPIEVGAASHPRGGYAPISETRPTTASSVSSTSPDNRPGTTMNLVDGTAHAHDGFSSAFGLMSLDDPSVLAGLASDGQPFFSSLGGALTTPTPARERERAGAGGILSRSADTDREAETRDLRDFWKQYMRTPLSIGTGASGGPSFAENGGILGGGAGGAAAGAVGSGARPGMGKRGLSRVASMPSVKTPGLELAPPSAYALNPVQQQSSMQHGQGQSQMSQHAQDDSYLGPQQRTYHAADDLRRYEAAVLSRKAPVQLNLIPRRARTNSGIDEGYSTQASSSVSPPSQINTVLEESALRGMSSSVSPPNHPAVIPQRTKMAPPPDPTTIASASLAGSFDAERPSFKRNASQTLGPENAKRTMRESDIEYTLDDSEGDVGGADAYAFYARGGSESPVPPEERRAYAPLPERYRRMSAPQAPMGLVGPHGGHHMVQPPEPVPYA